MSVEPTLWTPEQITRACDVAMSDFREVRVGEPLELYLENFDRFRDAVDNLLELTADLAQLEALAVQVVSNADLLYAVRYLAGPPISDADLRVLAEASLAPTSLRRNPEMAVRVVQTVLGVLDRRRFPWVAEDREPTEAEKEAAAVASAALIASQRVGTHRRNQSKTAQEKEVSTALAGQGLEEIAPRTVRRHEDGPARGQFCSECYVGDRKADILIRLWDGRLMPLECKVSNSTVNSYKRLNNDAAVKAVAWRRDFGVQQIVPGAVLSGVYKPANVEAAQAQGLSIFWAHDLAALLGFIEATRE